MAVQDLINQFNGQHLTVTGPDAGECTAVAHKWEQMCGLPIVYGNAVDTYNNAGAGYTKIQNTPSGVPQAGDIVVWGANARVGTGSAGHTSVATGGGDTNTFVSFDQNWPTGAPCALVRHTYDGVIGWFRPQVAAQPTNSGGSNMPFVPQEQIDAWLHGPDGIDHWKVTAYNKDVELNGLKQQVSTQEAEISDLKTKLASSGTSAPDSIGIAVRAVIDVIVSYIKAKN